MLNASARFVVITIGIFLLAAFLAGGEGSRRWVETTVTPTVIIVVIALLVVTFHNQKGSNPVLQALFANSGFVTFLVLAFGLYLYRTEAQTYVISQFCRSGSTFGRIVRTAVCEPLGLVAASGSEAASAPTSSYGIPISLDAANCLGRVWTSASGYMPKLGCEKYTATEFRDGVTPTLVVTDLPAYQDCLARSIVEGLGAEGRRRVSCCGATPAAAC